MFFDKGDFRRSDFTYGVTKDQNVESLFSEFFLVFDVLIFVVLTIPQGKYKLTLNQIQADFNGGHADKNMNIFTH
jgi:hypothetical protein